jgi:hypothetical protein
MAEYGNKALVMGILEAAAQDRTLLDRLEASPNQVFAEAGMLVHPDTVAEFNALVRQQIGGLLASLRSGGALMAWPSLGCSACNIAAFVVGAAIVAVGAAAISTLTTTSPAVVGLAAWAGYSTTATLAFIQSIAGSVAAGVSSVCSAICTWIGACP